MANSGLSGRYIKKWQQLNRKQMENTQGDLSLADEWESLRNRGIDLWSRMRLLSLAASINSTRDNSVEMVGLALDACVAAARETLSDLAVLPSWPGQSLQCITKIAYLAWATIITGLACGRGSTEDEQLLGIGIGIIARSERFAKIDSGLRDMVELSAEAGRLYACQRSKVGGNLLDDDLQISPDVACEDESTVRSFSADFAEARPDTAMLDDCSILDWNLGGIPI
ncbi:MAG: hypothetical protein M1820_006228 [Bogoriella megaspora]|nr:MAG: hypothetical protein M1820_006228 [Bogoriella megaspora]